jgi:hypothetical protein
MTGAGTDGRPGTPREPPARGTKEGHVDHARDLADMPAARRQMEQHLTETETHAARVRTAVESDTALATAADELGETSRGSACRV